MISLTLHFSFHFRFQAIPLPMLEVFSAVKELTLSGNPFHCNCELRWLRQFYSMVFDKVGIVFKYCYLTLPDGVSIDVAGQEPPSFRVLDSTRGLLEGEARPFRDVVTQLQSWPPSPALALDHAIQ